MGNNCKNKKNIWHKCRKYVVQILRLAGGVIHLSNLNGWTIPYYKSLPGSHHTKDYHYLYYWSVSVIFDNLKPSSMKKIEKFGSYQPIR